MFTLFPSENLKNKRVFVRADLNIEDSASAHRLEAIQPTLNSLYARGAKIILATHIGRPTHQNPELSTRTLLPWFTQHQYAIDFEPDLEQAYQKSFTDQNTIVLLENLRFFPEEQSCDPTERKKLTQKLARLADFYVNDAFGALHRNDTSITDLPLLFPPEKRSLGLLVIRELTQLQYLLTNPKRPFLAFFGGNKVETKITLIKNLIPKLDTIALCPALVFSFLHSLKKPIGKSFIDLQSHKEITTIFSLIKKHHVELLFPIDYTVTDSTRTMNLHTIDANNFPPNAHGISIGPKTTDMYIKKINESHTILYNGLSGFINQQQTLQETYKIFHAMNFSNARTIIAGGDSVAVAQQAGYTNNISYLSTGGGSTLAYLSGQSLPGLDAFKNQLKKLYDRT